MTTQWVRKTGIVALAVGVMAAAACSSDSEPSTAEAPADDGAEQNTEPAAEPVDYSGRGPYAVGTIDLELDPDHAVAVFYPVDPDAVADDSEPYIYSGATIFDPSVAALLPDALGGEFAPPDTWLGLPASDAGPFPIVLHSHGAAGNYRFAGFHNGHTASWGHVVVSVDHPERGVVAAIASIGGDGGEGGGPSDQSLDTDQLLAALDLVEAEGATAGSPLEGTVDGSAVAGEGHSAGGSATGAAAYDARIGAWIAQASGGAIDPDVDLDPYLVEDPDSDSPSFDGQSHRDDNPPPPVPAMQLTAEGDTVVEPAYALEATFDWLETTPKALGVINDSGHAVFVDVCVPIRDSGGLSAFVEALGIDPTDVGLVRVYEDGCLPDDVDPEAVWEVIDHMTVAFLVAVFGDDPAVGLASLDPDYVDATFPDLVERVEVVG